MRKSIITAAAIMGSAITVQPAAAAGLGGCAAAAKLVPATSTCIEMPNGIAIADTPAEAASLAEIGKGAETRFEKHIGRKPSPYALVSSTAKIDLDAIKTLGYGIRAHWQTDAQHDESMLASLKTSIDKMVSERGLPQDRADQLYNEALDRHSKRMATGERAKSKGGMIPHQIGHGWFTAAFWPQSPAITGDAHSAGPAPDWLEEIAALLLEDDYSSNRRREQFKGGYKGNGEDPMTFLMSSEDLMNLTDLLTKPNPMSLMVGGSGVRMMMSASSRGGPASPMASAPVYGVKARMFADYLIERSGQPAIFGKIAAAASQNMSFDQWLSGEGKGLGLPGDIPALEADWKAWLLKKLGKPA